MGLVIPSDRSPGGFRLYTDADVARLRLVKYMKPLKLTLEEMRELLAIRERLAALAPPPDDGADADPLVWPSGAEPDHTERQALVDRLTHYLELSGLRLAKLRRQVEEVADFSARLQQELDRHSLALEGADAGPGTDGTGRPGAARGGRGGRHGVGRRRGQPSRQMSNTALSSPADGATRRTSRSAPPVNPPTTSVVASPSSLSMPTSRSRPATSTTPSV